MVRSSSKTAFLHEECEHKVPWTAMFSLFLCLYIRKVALQEIQPTDYEPLKICAKQNRWQKQDINLQVICMNTQTLSIWLNISNAQHSRLAYMNSELVWLYSLLFYKLGHSELIQANYMSVRFYIWTPGFSPRLYHKRIVTYNPKPYRA